MKVPAYSFLEPPLEYNQDAFDESRFAMTFLNVLGVMDILCSFKLVLKGKTGTEIPESSRLAEDNISGPLNRGDIANLSLLSTLLAIPEKSREPSFWK